MAAAVVVYGRETEEDSVRAARICAGAGAGAGSSGALRCSMLRSYNSVSALRFATSRPTDSRHCSPTGAHWTHGMQALRESDVDVIHCDLKPENVMLLGADDHRIKVIDFGSSCSARHRPFSYVQSRFYRSPEVLLGCSYSYAIDMWSFGCMLAEMHTGTPLFNGRDQQEQMYKIVSLLGMPPDCMLSRPGHKSKVHRIFKHCPDTGSWQMASVPGNSNTDKKRRSLGEAIRSRHAPESDEAYQQMEDLMMCVLALDPEVRFSPTDALRHPFLASSSTAPTPSTMTPTPTPVPSRDMHGPVPLDVHCEKSLR